MRAVEDGGTVRVGARTEEGAVVVKVEDDGPGVPAADRERIFEAFYTTRPAGQGTGLGLPVARGLAREGGGDLVLMETARGAVFELRLPAAERR
jgi:signal transduction histidine kinase